MDQERAKTIEKLLNLCSLEKNRTALQKAKKALEEELKVNQNKEKTYIHEISNKLGVEQSSWIEAINEIRFQLGGNPVSILEKDSIIKDLSLVKTTVPKTEVVNLIQRISDVYRSFCCGANSLLNQISTTKLICEKMLLSQEFKEKMDYIVLYEQGKKLLKTNICPLCEQTLDDKERLARSLQDKVDKLIEIKEVFNEYQGAIKVLRENLATIQKQLSTSDLSTLSNYMDSSNLRKILEDINSFYDLVSKNAFSPEVAQNFLSSKYENEIKTYHDELCKISAAMALDQKELNYKDLVDLNAKYNLLCEL